MAEKPKTGVEKQGSYGGEKKQMNWAELSPVSVDYEDSMNAGKVKEVWQKMYQLAGLRNPSEDEQASFRLACYVYACINGTSRVGNFSGQITTSGGTVFPASVISRATGGLNIRQFFRGNMSESYEALKMSGCIERDERYVAKVLNEVGASAECAFATSDWMTNCPHFTPAERAAHNASFDYSVRRARNARGGRSLEAVEKEGASERLAAGAADSGFSQGSREVTF